MELSEIKQAVLTLYQECSIHSFPLSCSSILAHYKLKLYTYSQLKTKSHDLYELSRQFSQDAFTYGPIICFNDTMPPQRIRFSLMHELGHILLHSENERDANLFSSHLLAPRILLSKAACRNPQEVRILFDLSNEAARYAMEDCTAAQNHWTDIDRKILEHFYNVEEKIYIYHITECPICGGNIYNSFKNTCLQCKKLSIKSR